MNARTPMLAVLLLAVTVPESLAQAQPSSLDAHSINADSEYFVAEQQFEGGYSYVTLARMLQRPSSATSEAEFLGIGGPKAGQQFRSRWYWRTRIARPDDLRIGRLAFCLDAQANGVYRPPQSRAEATQTSWFVGTIVDLSFLRQEEVILDAYRANPACLRVPEGNTDLPNPPPPTLDQQFVDSADYFVRTEEYEGGYGGYVTLARMLRAPTTASSGEAEFVSLQNSGGHLTGQRFWTRWFWRARAASQQDLREGTTVIVLDAQDQGVYRAPHDRFEVVTTGWWVGAITDMSGMFRGEVQVGDYRVRPDAMRVIMR